jgi:uncharacterized RDD family membrane protein YckC
VAGVIDLVLLTALATGLQSVLAIQSPEMLAAVSAVYFILAYAATGNGYSVGKRALSIRVVDRHGNPLSLAASAVRWLVLVGIALPLGALIVNFERAEPMGAARAMTIAVPVLSVMLVDSYLFLFNRRTRQSLHDLAAGSFVVPRSHRGAVPVAPLWRGHAGWIVACCVAVTAGFPVAYRRARELVPRVTELMRARERILVAHRIRGFLVIPDFATEGADTTWYVSVLGRIDAAPQTEHEAESLRLALACALLREAPRTFRNAEVRLMVSFERGAARAAGGREYLVGSDLTPAACAKLPTRF